MGTDKMGSSVSLEEETQIFHPDNNSTVEINVCIQNLEIL
jgi:hypothetical protein